MEVAKIALPLIFSRLGEMTASLLYFAFIGNFIAGSLDDASLAWATTSFLTVVGIGLFLTTLIKVAESPNLNDDASINLIISLRLAVALGLIITISIYAFTLSDSRLHANINESQNQAKAILALSLSIPAVYLQIVIFNFFNALKKTHYELIFIWTFNISFASACILIILNKTHIGLIFFILTYSGLRCLFACLAFILFRIEIRQHIAKFRYFRNITASQYGTYLIVALPMALCLGGESLIYFIFSFISNNLDKKSLSAYQASIHFLSIVYMISIGSGNAAGIIAARHYKLKDIKSVATTYTQGLTLGIFILTPFLFACFFLKENIAAIYTSDIPTRTLIERNILTSIPFLIFEYIYTITRMTLRSMGDIWFPTLITIASLNLIGLSFSIGLLLFHEKSVHSLFISLAACSFLLMVLLLWRLKHIIKIITLTIRLKSR
ncbi:MATE family efflux transporter [Pseudomonas baetica]|uniref:MATE family efflux transporter n=1 Tax=Pseudomonas baetica TaxID=674054 RepID=UPI003EEFF649